jgi:hypothetical protein
MAQTALDIIEAALRRINSYQHGETIAQPDQADCLETLNDLLESWSTDKQQIFGSQEHILQWVNGQKQYKIGNPTCTDLGEPPFTGTLSAGSTTISGITNMPSDLIVDATLTDVANVIPAGTTVTAISVGSLTMSASATATPAGTDNITYTIPGDFAVPRPLRITGGYTRINELDFWLDVYMSQDEYNAILLKIQPGPWPTVMWYNPLMPYGILNVYMTPGQNAELHLFTDTILSNLTLTQTLILPQGYSRALKWNLAKELWSEYWSGTPIPSSISVNAKESLNAIKALNAQPPQRAGYDRALIRGNRPDGSWIIHGGFN